MNCESVIVLASASPRRKELMAKAGYRFEVVPADIDESAYDSQDVEPVEYAKTLALAKARCVASEFGDNIVVGADTIVDSDGLIIGKPEDPEHAREIIVKLFSAPHKVITGLAIMRLCDNVEIAASETTIVYPRKMSEEQIACHIEGGSWRGKAGAYGIQETGDEFVERIEGSFSNVMGLPMELLETFIKGISGGE